MTTYSYDRLLDSSYGTCANIGTSEAVLYSPSSSQGLIRFIHIHNTSTTDKTLSLHHWASGQTVSGTTNRFFSQVVYSGTDLVPEFPVPGKIVKAGEKIVAAPDTVAATINMDICGGLKI